MAEHRQNESILSSEGAGEEPRIDGAPTPQAPVRQVASVPQIPNSETERSCNGHAILSSENSDELQRAIPGRLSEQRDYPETNTRFAGRLLIGGVIVVACIAGFWTGSASWPSGHGLAVEPSSLDLGTVWEQHDFKWTLPVRNELSRDVDVVGFASSCSCVSVQPKSLSIPSGQSAQLTLTLDLSHGSNDGSDSQFRKFSASIMPRLRESKSPTVTWRITGTVRKPFSLSEDMINLGHVSDRNSPSQVRVVNLRAHAGIRGLSCEVNPPIGTAIASRKEEDRDDYCIAIRLKPDVALGPFLFEVLIHAQLQDGVTVTASLPVMGRVQGDLHVDPEFLGFGPRRLGETLAETVLVMSRNQQEFEVVGLRCDADNTKVSPGAGSSTNVKSFRVEHVVTRLGPTEFEVQYFVRTGRDGATTTLTQKLCYYGYQLETHN